MSSSLYTPIRVVIADDHEIFREGLEGLIRKQADMEFTGEAENGKMLLEVIRETKPDVVLTDIKMPVIDGVQATQVIAEKYPQVSVIALSMFDDENLIVDMLEAGAKGYLIKNAHKHEIIAAIKTVYNQEYYFCNHSSMKLARLIGKSRFNFHKDFSRPEFSSNEKEVIRMICEELSTKEIASKLSLSSRTIDGYREKILEKMNVKNSAGIAVYAIKHGLYKP
jgi:two-component system, NarL family, response regulator NreC